MPLLSLVRYFYKEIMGRKLDKIYKGKYKISEFGRARNLRRKKGDLQRENKALKEEETQNR